MAKGVFMKLCLYGAAKEVGRSCVCLDNRFLFDSGLKICEDGTEYPLEFDASKIDAVFLSHAHLDHSGALPLLNQRGLRCPIFCNSMTRELSKLLMLDSFKIELLTNQFPEYNKENIKQVIRLMQNARYNKEYHYEDISFSYCYAGHIPGSASIALNYKNKKIVYSGDINSLDTELMAGASFGSISALKSPDILIIEATYGNRDHPGRKQQEKSFISSIKETLKSGGVAIVPAFAVGRAQEIILLLDKYKINAKIYLDGMAKKVSNILLKKPEFIRNSIKLRDALRKVTYIKKWSERKEIVKSPCVIITTSGMVDGGPVLDYIKYCYHNEKNRILLTGYQTEESNGRLLLDEGKAYIDGIRLKVKCPVEKYDFSAHSGKKELLEAIKALNPKLVVLNHGDPEAISEFSKALDEINVASVAPELGKEVVVDKHIA